MSSMLQVCRPMRLKLVHCSCYWPYVGLWTGGCTLGTDGVFWVLRLMDKILHDPKDPKLWELWYIPYYG